MRSIVELASGLASGQFAAKAVIEAKKSGRYDAAAVSIYQKLLEESFVLKDFRTFQETPKVLSNPHLFGHYPELIGNLMRDLYTVPAGQSRSCFPRRSLESPLTMIQHSSVPSP